MAHIVKSTQPLESYINKKWCDSEAVRISNHVRNTADAKETKNKLLGLKHKHLK